MKIKKDHMLLYIVTDRAWLGARQLSEQVEDSLHAGATMVQLREKDMGFGDFVKEAKEIGALTKKYQVPFIINDNVDVAVAADADGVHLGQEDGDLAEIRKRLGKDKIIGISAHNVEEALKAQADGADYLGVGAVFPTDTKKDANPLTLGLLKSICGAVHIPVVAIGGITKDNIMNLAGSGVDGVAVISAIFAQKDIGKATRELLDLSKLL
ncbi:MAG TPA: thiamine phosphate synthase [Clostridiales bacterium]|nr:thiamine phosphate synthase [Clostridiales bacterium]